MKTSLASAVGMPTLVCVIIMTAISATIIFASDQLPAFSYFGITVTILGLLVSLTLGRKTPGDSLRWRVAVNAMLISLLIYGILGYIASVREESGLLSFALSYNIIIFLPTALFLSYMLSFPLLGSRHKGAST